MEPSEKSPVIESFLNDMSNHIFGRSRTDSIRDNICVDCGNPATHFNDEISRKEYSITGMCQVCQEKMGL